MLCFILKVKILFCHVDYTTGLRSRELVKNARSEARATFDARSEVEVELGALKENNCKLAEQLKEAVRARGSAKARLKTTEKQLEDY